MCTLVLSVVSHSLFDKVITIICFCLSLTLSYILNIGVVNYCRNSVKLEVAKFLLQVNC